MRFRRSVPAGSTRSVSSVAARSLPALVALALAVACVGSGKTAHTEELGALPGYSVVYDSTASCREGESGFDYRFVVLRGDDDLSTNGPLLTALRANGFTVSNPFYERLPWTTVTYQHVVNPDGTQYALGLEIGSLRRYLADPASHTGPDPAALPAEAREHPEDHLLVALRPTDFSCTTPL